MPLDAYLNSEADKLATIGLKRTTRKVHSTNGSKYKHSVSHRRENNKKRLQTQTVREVIQLKPLRKFYCKRFRWSDNIFDDIDWDIFRPVYKKYISSKDIQWFHKYCIKKLPTGERVHKRDHFHDKRCASCWHLVKDDDHIFTSMKRKTQQNWLLCGIILLANRRFLPYNT